ncbi:MAG: hypothetical protein NTY96_09500 [Bacteroidetes bacterium]|nr:hypothetical protein [Bacteroidota bacterium]
MIAKKQLYVIVLILLCAFAVQKKTGLIHSKGLEGFVPKDPVPSFTNKSWLDGTFQSAYSNHINNTLGFRSDLVRLYNQIDFSLFRILHANKIVIGNGDYLIAQQYIEASLGYDFAGKAVIDRNVELMKALQDKLEQTAKVHFLVLFVPDKGTFYPEIIPQRYLKKKQPLTNYAYYVERCRAVGVNFIDCNGWFLKMKDSSRYILYPKTGIHWSTYGSMLAIDSMMNYLRIKFGLNIPRLAIDSITLSSKAKYEDDDIGRTLNLIKPLAYPPLAYPSFRFIADTAKPKPRALFVGDSFYWQLYYPGFIANMFSNSEFWYYNKDVYPETFNAPKSTDQLNYIKDILSQDLVVLIQTNAAYGNVGYGFVQQTWQGLSSDGDRVKEFEKSIRNTPDWLEKVRQKAKQNTISLDEQIHRDAVFMANEEIMNSKKK